MNWDKQQRERLQEEQQSQRSLTKIKWITITFASLYIVMMISILLKP